MAPDISFEADWNSISLDGEWVPSESGEELAIEDPSTREVVDPASLRNSSPFGTVAPASASKSISDSR